MTKSYTNVGKDVMKKTSREEQVEMIREFIVTVQQARGGDIPQPELEGMVDWFDVVLQGVMCVNLVKSGHAVMHWDKDTKEPFFELTDQGFENTNQENPKDKTLLN
jgi:hypothetical protein